MGTANSARFAAKSDGCGSHIGGIRSCFTGGGIIGIVAVSRSIKTTPRLALTSLALVACGHAPSTDSATSQPILVQDGATYTFEPADVPRDASTSLLTAQDAYNSLTGRQVPIPGSVTVAYGYLTEDDT
ncbi:MAG TPA: hypothetical protein VLI04_20165, partial [Nocardioidaceae bacterium]|nr:hypothetical protein [Nocardioidaceae bacterium]